MGKGISKHSSIKPKDAQHGTLYHVQDKTASSIGISWAQVEAATPRIKQLGIRHGRQLPPQGNPSGQNTCVDCAVVEVVVGASFSCTWRLVTLPATSSYCFGILLLLLLLLLLRLLLLVALLLFLLVSQARQQPWQQQRQQQQITTTNNQQPRTTAQLLALSTKSR